MSLPDTLDALPTLASVLAARGDEPDALYGCPLCPRTGPASFFVCTDGLSDLPRFCCPVCASGPFREAAHKRERKAKRDAGPDWSDVRAQRDTKLARSDWTQMPDTPLTGNQKSAWAKYRKALRDLTTSGASPQAIQWPEPPQ